MRCKDTPFYPYTQDEKLLFIPSSYPFLSFIGGEWNALFQQSATTTLILPSYYPCHPTVLTILLSLPSYYPCHPTILAKERKDQQRRAGEKENMSNRQPKKGKSCRICNPQGRTKNKISPSFHLGRWGGDLHWSLQKEGRLARVYLHPWKEFIIQQRKPNIEKSKIGKSNKERPIKDIARTWSLYAPSREDNPRRDYFTGR